MVFNPFAVSRVGESETDTRQYALPQSAAFAVPSLEAGDAYIDEFGWAPVLARGNGSAVEVPSAQRLGSIPRRDYRPDPVRPPEEFFDRLGADNIGRHGLEDVHPTGWREQKGVLPTDRRWEDDPRRTPPAEHRWTMGMAPSTYSFTRLFDQFNRTHAGDPLTGSARQFNGNHFSMADHRRTYEVGGMAPVHSARNTYRLTPPPWDTDVVDLPPVQGSNTVNARVRSVELPFGTRSWRL